MVISLLLFVIRVLKLNRADQCSAADLESNKVVTLQLPSGEGCASQERPRLIQARVKRQATSLAGTGRIRMSIYEGGSSGQTRLVEPMGSHPAFTDSTSVITLNRGTFLLFRIRSIIH
jgi:hypothetical protein